MASKYKPFINIGPGFFIEEELEERGWSKSDLANIIGVSQTHVSGLIHDTRPITIEMAKLLSQAFNQSAQYWLNLYNNYILRQEEVPIKKTDAQIKAEIYTYMPIADMVKKGWIDKWNHNINRLVDSVKGFWGITELDFSFMEAQSPPAFRKSEAFSKYNQYFALTWYHQAKKTALNYTAAEYSKKKLIAISKKISEYSWLDNGIEQFIEDLNDAGVKFFTLNHLGKTYTDGAAFWDGDNPVIVWTGRYKRCDNFWFTVAHEIAHILLHFRKKSAFFIDCENMYANNQEEEANLFAQRAIKNEEIFKKFNGEKITSTKVKKYSEQAKISPALVVGQLQHMKFIQHYQLRNLIEKDVLNNIPPKYINA
ncbi:MAG: HigA family addiction module antitoxin [Sedimentisphaeraceae bacterium JB056]